MPGTDRIRVDWEHPAQLNGVLERYLLYASTEAQALGDVTYNNTDLFLYYVMEELLAGTTYFIAVGVCAACAKFLLNLHCILYQICAVSCARSALYLVPKSALHLGAVCEWCAICCCLPGLYRWWLHGQ